MGMTPFAIDRRGIVYALSLALGSAAAAGRVTK